MLFDSEPKGRVKELLDKLVSDDFDSEALRAELDSGKYDAEDVNTAALLFVDECNDEFSGWEIDHGWYRDHQGETIPGYASSHMTEAIRLLLDYGLDPNKIYQEIRDGKVLEEFNIMQMAGYIINGYQAADTLYLLLGNGGNPNLVINHVPMIDEVYFDVCFATVERQDHVLDMLYDANIHYWLVLAGFSAVHGNEMLPLDPVEDFDLKLLREHRNYYYGVIHSNRTKEGWDLCIFDKKTSWEVARL